MADQKIFVTVDAVVFKLKNDAAEILLIQRKNEPFKNQWALPGGFVEQEEDLEIAALRELKEETGIEITSCEQFFTFGKPGRDPRGRTISIAFVGFAGNEAMPKAADDAKDARWFSIENLPVLAFDHNESISLAISRFLPEPL